MRVKRIEPLSLPTARRPPRAYRVVVECSGCRVMDYVTFPCALAAAECRGCGTSNVATAARAILALGRQFEAGAPVIDFWGTVDSESSIPKDSQRALECYHHAAAWNDPEALLFLGHRLPLDEAAEYYLRAVDVGDWRGYRWLASRAVTDCCPPDHGAALLWLRQGAERGLGECWGELLTIYVGADAAYTHRFVDPPSAHHAMRRYIECLRGKCGDSEAGRPAIERLRMYLGFRRANGADATTDAALETFLCRWRADLERQPGGSAYQTQHQQVLELLTRLRC